MGDMNQSASGNGRSLEGIDPRINVTMEPKVASAPRKACQDITTDVCGDILATMIREVEATQSTAVQHVYLPEQEMPERVNTKRIQYHPNNVKNFDSTREDGHWVFGTKSPTANALLAAGIAFNAVDTVRSDSGFWTRAAHIATLPLGILSSKKWLARIEKISIDTGFGCVWMLGNRVYKSTIVVYVEVVKTYRADYSFAVETLQKPPCTRYGHTPPNVIDLGDLRDAEANVGVDAIFEGPVSMLANCNKLGIAITAKRLMKGTTGCVMSRVRVSVQDDFKGDKIGARIGFRLNGTCTSGITIYMSHSDHDLFSAYVAQFPWRTRIIRESNWTTIQTCGDAREILQAVQEFRPQISVDLAYRLWHVGPRIEVRLGIIQAQKLGYAQVGALHIDPRINVGVATRLLQRITGEHAIEEVAIDTDPVTHSRRLRVSVLTAEATKLQGMCFAFTLGGDRVYLKFNVHDDSSESSSPNETTPDTPETRRTQRVRTVPQPTTSAKASKRDDNDTAQANTDQAKPVPWTPGSFVRAPRRDDTAESPELESLRLLQHEGRAIPQMTWTMPQVVKNGSHIGVQQPDMKRLKLHGAASRWFPIGKDEDQARKLAETERQGWLDKLVAHHESTNWVYLLSDDAAPDDELDNNKARHVYSLSKARICVEGSAEIIMHSLTDCKNDGHVAAQARRQDGPGGTPERGKTALASKRVTQRATPYSQ